jgi:hypothetical protein
MDRQLIDQRKRLARATFGRELTTEQVVALGPRIDAVARNVAILDAWEQRLGQTEPAAVYVAPTGNNDDDG